ncbi:basic proline-rich protein-like [Equus quagga]|uniref:basic proline-rich protein-like n=1 Tax=Equus quagga TaxID=89248 RepID=UPI001EE3754C|nr:basic proline-rich protein-like [Equus quagga]
MAKAKVLFQYKDAQSPDPAPAWDRRCSGPGGRTPEPRTQVRRNLASPPGGPGTPAQPGHSAAGSCQPRRGPPGLPRSPWRTPAQILLEPRSTGRSARASPCARPSRPPGPPPLTARRQLRRPGRETPAAREREREDERAGARRRRRRRQKGRLSPRPELPLLPPGAGGAFPAEPRRRERGRPLTAARARGQRARRPQGLSRAQPGPHGQASFAAAPKPRPEAPVPPPGPRPPNPRGPAQTPPLRPASARSLGSA